MKKFLLTAGLFSLVLAGKSQTILNEVYGNPGSGNSEFIELYNSGLSDQNMDCFTIVTYWEEGANKGWYVLDLPSVVVPSKGWYVVAPVTPFNVQGTSGATANLNWNDATFRTGGTSGFIAKYQYNGVGYDNVTPAAGVAIDEIAVGSLNGGQYYITLLFQDGAFINGFIGGGASGTLPAAVSSLPTLNVVTPGACGDLVANFGSLGVMEFFNPSGGNDNGYARTSDGKCGAWVKTAPQVNHTPGTTNGSAAGLAGSLTTTELLKCSVSTPSGYVSRIIFDITGLSGDASEAADFPVTVTLYYDYGGGGLGNRNPNGILDGADSAAGVKVVNTVAALSDSFDIKQAAYTLLVYKTQRGCFDKVVAIANTCAVLPVNFKSFTATRTSSSDVALKFETASEDNNAGFSIERNVLGVWQQIAYLPSQAADGTSNTVLTYQYGDINTIKGITQYRIKQIDLDGKFKYSIIRAVRGQGQIGKTIVYPNPSNTGKVTVVFEDNNTSRDALLIDMSGRTVKSWKNTTNNIQIDNLTPGIYTLRIVIPETGEQSVEKIVVNKR